MAIAVRVPVPAVMVARRCRRFRQHALRIGREPLAAARTAAVLGEPSTVRWRGVFAGSTAMPQTGSRAASRFRRCVGSPSREVDARGTRRAPRGRMQWLLVMVMVGGMGIGGASAALGKPTLETPRATDLLRAQRLADDVEERRRLPPAQRGSRWRRGGDGGWGSREGSASSRGGSEVIKRAPSRRGRGGE